MINYSESLCELVPEETDWDSFAGSIRDRLTEGGWTALIGDLGSGKTSFVRALVKRLHKGGKLSVTSPTFGLCHRYPTVPELWHFDLYRLQEDEPLERVDWDPATFDKKIVLVEWADRFPFPGQPPQRVLQFRWQAVGRQVRLLEAI